MKQTLEYILNYFKGRTALFQDDEGNSEVGKMVSGEWKIFVIDGKQVVKLEIGIEDENGVHNTIFDVDSINIREIDKDGNLI